MIRTLEGTLSTLSWRSCRRRATRAPRGQTLVIAALIMLVVAVAVFLTFSIGHRTREKVKLQAVADASAYSLAVVEARTFNFYAFGNRARVAHEVSILSIHAHQSYISWYLGLMKNTAKNFRTTRWQWVGYCACLLAPNCAPKCQQSCRNVGLAGQIAKLFEDEPGGSKWIQDRYVDLGRYDKLLATASLLHFGLVGAIIKQQELLDVTLKGMMFNQTLATSIAQQVDPKITGLTSSSAVSLAHYDKALGMNDHLGEDWLEILFTTRYPNWITKRYFIPGAFFGAILAKANQKASGDMVVVLPVVDGTAMTVAPDPSTPAALRRELEKTDKFGGGHAFGAADHGSSTVTWFSPPMCPTFAIRSWTDGIYSEPDEPGHSKAFHSYGGSNRMEPDKWIGAGHGLGGCDWRDRTRCGIYGANPRYKLHDGDQDKLWYQPRTVVAVTKQQNTGTALPWDFDFESSFPFPAKFSTRKSRGDSMGGPMAAIAGGLVYYHKPLTGRQGGDHWKEPPSVWNPFWRAKLHPLAPTDAAAALAMHPSRDLILDFNHLYHY